MFLKLNTFYSLKVLVSGSSLSLSLSHTQTFLCVCVCMCVYKCIYVYAMIMHNLAMGNFRNKISPKIIILPWTCLFYPSFLLALKWTTWDRIASWALSHCQVTGLSAVLGGGCGNETKLKQKTTLCKVEVPAECLRGPMAGAEQAGFGEVYGSFERMSQKAEPQLQGNALHKRVPSWCQQSLGELGRRLGG